MTNLASPAAQTPAAEHVRRAQSILANVRALIEKEWPMPDTYAYDTYAFSQAPVREWPEPERDYSMDAIRERFRESQHLGTFRKRGKNNYTCPVCSALVHIDDIHRHADWHAMPS